MKVLALNGSPKKEGNTYGIIRIFCDTLEKEGIETEIIHAGEMETRGCVACLGCRNSEDGMCVLADDEFRALVRKILAADGLVIGSPVYYGSIAGGFKTLLDRIFYSSSAELRHKVGAALTVARRSGEVGAVHQLNNYFLLSEMIIAPSRYWNGAHGSRPGEVTEDLEAVDGAVLTATNMAWILKMCEQTKGSLPTPPVHTRRMTNFIR